MAGKKKVLMLLSNPFRPDSRVYNEALALLRHGYSVTIIAWDREGGWPKQETRDGIDILRVGPPAEGKRHFIRNVRRFWKNAGKAAKNIRFDSIHSHDFDTLPLGVRLKRKRKVPLVFDAHEIYSQMVRIDVPSPVVGLIQFYEDICLKKVDRLITVIDGHMDFYRKKIGDKVTVVMNIKPGSELPESEINKLREDLGLGGCLSFVLIGSLEDKKFVPELVEASKRLSGVKILVGGYGKYSEFVEESSRGNPNLTYLGHVHPGMVVPYTAAADMVVSVYYPRQPMAVATKFFDGVSAGTPLLVNEDGDMTTRLVKKYNCGLAIPYDTNAFVKAAESLKNNPRRIQDMRGNIIAIRKKYSWATMEQRLLRLYENLW